MSSFLYPKARHVRKLSPPQFRQYGSYKRYVQSEFARKCVYCCAADTSAVGVVFGVDHYRPKSLFSSAITEYSNLFYCCSACNSRKNDYWPEPGFELKKFVPNPCDHLMFKHLRYRDGKVVALSEAGEFTLALLDLNDAATVAHRRHVIHTIEVLQFQLQRAEKLCEQLQAKIDAGRVDQERAQVVRAKIDAGRKRTEDSLARLLGTLPLPPIRVPRTVRAGA